MEAVPPLARVYVACVALGAVACLLPVPLSTPVLPPAAVTHASWWAVALLAALYACCKQLARRSLAGPFYPVLLAAAFLLPPAAAALVPLPGALLTPVGPVPDR
ncbi:metal-dependent phosphohydrolase, partial [Streptomyces carpinensis]